MEWISGLVEYWNRGFALHAGEKCTENEIWSSLYQRVARLHLACDPAAGKSVKANKRTIPQQSRRTLTLHALKAGSQVMWTKLFKTSFLFVILYPFLYPFFYSRHVLLELNKYNDIVLYYVIFFAV